MIHQHGGIWQDYCERSGRAPACGFTSFYPTVRGMIAQSGDLGVAGYVAQSFAEGAIGYVNYSYALGAAVPRGQGAQRGRLLHRADARERGGVAAAGRRSTRDESSDDYLTQKLDGVYTDPDPRNYQLSSYSYFILPTKVAGPVQRGQGPDARRVRLLRDVPGPAAVGVARLLADADQPGQASFEQIRKIPGVEVQDIDITSCKNPTFSADGTNVLADNAPLPQECDKQGPNQCATGTGGLKKVVDPGDARRRRAVRAPRAARAAPGAPAARATGGTTGGTGRHRRHRAARPGRRHRRRHRGLRPRHRHLRDDRRRPRPAATAVGTAPAARSRRPRRRCSPASSGWSGHADARWSLVLLLIIGLVFAPAAAVAPACRRTTARDPSGGGGPAASATRRSALVVVVLVAAIASPSGARRPRASAGTDTSLPATDSQVTVSGRGRVRRPEDHGQPDQGPGEPGGLGHLDRRHADHARRPAASPGTTCRSCSAGATTTAPCPENPGPPPEQCVYGATDAVVRRPERRHGSRRAASPPSGSSRPQDWPSFDPNDGSSRRRPAAWWQPFRSVTGTGGRRPLRTRRSTRRSRAANYWLNPYFNVVTTNEIAGRRTGPDGTGAELFEVTTGLESTGLGCGQKVQPVGGGEPTVPKCWLVVVPRGDSGGRERRAPRSTRDVGSRDDLAAVATAGVAEPRSRSRSSSTRSTPGATSPPSQRRIVGSELPLRGDRELAAEALPDRRASRPTPTASIGDASARQQLAQPARRRAGHGRGLAPARPDRRRRRATPSSTRRSRLSATVIGFNVERNPDPTRAGRRSRPCTGVRVAELNLTPRLVAKLLTQSYRAQIAIIGRRTDYEWAKANPPTCGSTPTSCGSTPSSSSCCGSDGKNFGGLSCPPATPTRPGSCGSGSSPTPRPRPGSTAQPTSGGWW